MIIKHQQVHYHLPDGVAPRAKHRRQQCAPEPQLTGWIESWIEQHPGEVIHAGAFSGDLLPQLCACCRQVYAWEPVDYNYHSAVKTLELNGISNCVLRQAALGNTSGTLDMVVQFDGGYLLGGLCCVYNNGAVSPLLEKAQGPRIQTVAQETIDSYTYNHLQIIHLDLEGWEYQALEGAAHTIAKHRPVIIVEDTQHTADDLLATWNYTHTDTVSGDRVYTPGPTSAER